MDTPKDPSAARKSITELGLRQREIMDAVYELGEATVREVQERLSGSPAYTTVLTMMQKLERSGWLSHRTKGRRYVYLPARSKAADSQEALEALIAKVYDGDGSALLQQLLADRRLRSESQPSLRMFVDSKRSYSE